jgi:chromosome segregation ATPase
MFSKKVEEFDDLKQGLSTREKEVSVLQVEKGDLYDYKGKYQREAVQREELYGRYMQVNDQLESQAREHQDRIEGILNEKNELIQENRELNKQLSEAEDEIALLKQQLEESRNACERRESELDVERRRV